MTAGGVNLAGQAITSRGQSLNIGNLVTSTVIGGIAGGISGGIGQFSSSMGSLPTAKTFWGRFAEVISLTTVEDTIIELVFIGGVLAGTESVIRIGGYWIVRAADSLSDFVEEKKEKRKTKLRTIMM